MNSMRWTVANRPVAAGEPNSNLWGRDCLTQLSKAGSIRVGAGFTREAGNA